MKRTVVSYSANGKSAVRYQSGSVYLAGNVNFRASSRVIYMVLIQYRVKVVMDVSESVHIPPAAFVPPTG